MSNLTPIAPRQDRRCFCGEEASPEPHHILHKSLGGTDHDHNLLDICAKCHAALHPEKMGGRGWKIAANSVKLLRILDNATGEIVYEQEFDPKFDQGKHVGSLGLLPSYLRELTEQVRFLDEKGLQTAAETVYQQFGKAAWMYLGEVLRVSRLRMVRGTAEEKTRALASKFGIGLRQAQNLLQVMAAFETQLIASSPIDESTFFVVAARQPDPQAALAIAEEMKAEDPRATVKTFEAVLQSNDPLHRDYCGGDIIDGECTECGARPKHLRLKATSADYTIQETTERVLKAIDEGQRRANTPF